MSKARKILFAIFVLIISFILTPATGFSQASTTAPKEIILGLALPLTGGQSREGGYVNKAYAMALKEINDAGGIMVKAYGKKIPIKLIIYDDKSDNTTSVQLYEKLVTEDKVNALMGGYGTPLITAHTIVAEKYRALTISTRCYVLELGRIVLSGSGQDLLTDERVKTAYLGL